MMNFPAVSVRTSTERPEAVDSGIITIGNINSDSILQATEIQLIFPILIVKNYLVSTNR